MSKPKIRDENFKHLDALHFQCDRLGFALLGFENEPQKGWRAKYFNKHNKREPKVEECRDRLDYNLKFKEWMNFCTVASQTYPSFMAMIDGEVQRLRAMP